MTSKEYIEQQIAIGYTMHIHDGVWWLKVAPYFYRPVNPIQEIEYGTAKPKIHKALMGYSYLVRNKQQANKSWSKLILNSDKLNFFDIKSLSSSKRAQVRKGLKLNEIKKMLHLDPLIDDIKEVCISMAARTGYGKPSEYYEKHYQEWRASLIKQSQISGKERWGAFNEGKLIAFMNIVHIDDTVIIDNTQSHTDHLNKCPNDALVFSILDHCRALENCKKVIFGDWSNEVPSLNTFKQNYGFEKVDLPVYTKYNPIVIAFKKILGIWQKKCLL